MACLTAGTAATPTSAAAAAARPTQAPDAAPGVAASPAISGIGAGYSQTCVLLTGGGVACWGQNQFGQLGNGTTIDSASPVAVSGISDATAVARGWQHTCALLTGGGVDCWGDNRNGQLGDGTTTPRHVPVAVDGITDAIAIATGFEFSCALHSGGTISCWGWNGWGQLGAGTSVPESHAPVTVSGITNAVAISAGTYHACALLSDQTVECWGRNDWGNLGDGSAVERTSPVPVQGLADATAVSAGGAHTCAVRSTGGVECWGANGNGQLGAGSPDGSVVPIVVTGLSGAAAVTAGYIHTCALLAGGTVSCWGYNGSGQLGDGTTTERDAPVVISGVTGATAVSSTGFHTCALIDPGNVTCWGLNWWGQLGDSTVADRHAPAAVAWPPPGSPGAPVAVVATAANASATVAWSAPADDGGSPITTYTLTGSDGQTCVTADLFCALAGLQNNAVYKFTVTASNANGQGPATISGMVAPTTGTLTATIAKTSVAKAATSTIPVTLSWSTGLDLGGVASYTLQRVPGTGCAALTLSGLAGRSAAVAVAPSGPCVYRVRAITEEDEAVGAWITGTFRVTPRQESASTVKYKGSGWTRTSSGSPYGGFLRYVSASGRTATMTFTGKGIAWVSTLGKNRGKAEVWLDGKRVATISLYKRTTAARQIVFSRSFAASGAHKIVIKVLGKHASGATGNRVDLDAFLVLGP